MDHQQKTSQDLDQKPVLHNSKLTPPAGSKRAKIIIASLLVLVITLSAALLYTLTDSPSDSSNNTQPVSSSSENTESKLNASTAAGSVLEKIKADLLPLNPDDTSASEVVHVDSIIDKGAISTEVESDVYANFGRRNGLDIINTINAIMEKHGLQKSQKDEIVNNFSVSERYENDLIACDTFGNGSYARVNCVKKETFDRYKKMTSGLVKAYDELSGNTLQNVSVKYQGSKNGDPVVALLTGSTASDSYVNVLMAHNGHWEKRTDVTVDQGLMPIDCTVFSSQELTLFKRLNSASSCR